MKLYHSPTRPQSFTWKTWWADGSRSKWEASQGNGGSRPMPQRLQPNRGRKGHTTNITVMPDTEPLMCIISSWVPMHMGILMHNRETPGPQRAHQRSPRTGKHHLGGENMGAHQGRHQKQHQAPNLNNQRQWHHRPECQNLNLGEYKLQRHRRKGRKPTDTPVIEKID